MKSLEVAIGGKIIPLKVEQEEEALIIEIVEDLNKKLRELQLMYSNKDMSDCMAMTLLTFALDKYKQQQKESSDQQINAKLNEASTLLDKMLA